MAKSGPPVLRVGNDVVDLAHPLTQGKEADGRFLDRVFTVEERALLDGDRVVLWTLWAAKEAAYKVVCKERGERPVFRHRDFRVRPRAVGPREDEDRVRHGIVQHGTEHRAFRARTSSEWVHVVAVGGMAEFGALRAEVEPLPDVGPDWREVWRERFSPREWEGIHSFASAAVRLRCREVLAGEFRVPEKAFEIVSEPGLVGRRPPLLLAHGEPAGVDLSLSHHGRYVAWAFPRRGAETGAETDQYAGR